MSMGYFGMYKSNWYCRWCGSHTSSQRSERDGFCDNKGKCKQAWWRAYKKYRANVTIAGDRKIARAPKRNAKKQGKKKVS